MLQILNSRDRNQAFFKFLLFFTITVALVIFAVFFDFKMPTRENAMLHSEVNIQRQQEMNQLAFMNQVDQALVLLDSMSKPETNVNQVDLALSRKINDLMAIEENSHNLNKKLNKVLIVALGDLQQARRQLRDVIPKAQSLATLQAELRDCVSSKNELQQQNDQLRK
jgi:septal ring factor EnvC (AmiA/AmiB activator)